jgi:hypothetical protein
MVDSSLMEESLSIQTTVEYTFSFCVLFGWGLHLCLNTHTLY